MAIYNVDAETNFYVMGVAPFDAWTAIVSGDGSGYVNPIRRSASSRIAVGGTAVGFVPRAWVVSAQSSVGVLGTAALASLRHVVASASTSLAVGGAASLASNLHYTAVATTAMRFGVSAVTLANRLWAASARTSLAVGGNASLAANIHWLVSASSKVALAGSPGLSGSRNVHALTGLAIGGVPFVNVSKNVHALTSLGLGGVGFPNRVANVSATTALTLAVADDPQRLWSASKTDTFALAATNSVVHLVGQHLASGFSLGVSAQARVLLPGGLEISGGDSGAGPAEIVLTGLSGAFPATFAETPSGLVLVANGVDPMVRWDGLSGKGEYAGVLPPAAPIRLAGQGIGLITGQRYAFTRFIDRRGNPSNLSPVSNLVDMGRDALIDGIAFDPATGIVTIWSVAHGLKPSELVIFRGVGGLEALNGTQQVWHVLDPDHFTLNSVAVTSGTWEGGGSWTWGIGQVVYQGVPVPAESKVARRQILRNLDGDADVFYVDIDTTDLSSTVLYSTLDDEALSANEAVPIALDDETPYANRYGVPPSHKAIVVGHLGRIFATGDVDYSAGCVAVVSGRAAITGTGTGWPSSFAGRLIYPDGAQSAYEILSVDPATQTITLTKPYGDPTQPWVNYVIRSAPAERKLVYYSEPLQPEAWPPWNAFSLPEDSDRIVGMVVKGTYLYLLEQRHIYRYSVQQEPSIDGYAFYMAARGAVNHRCCVQVEDDLYLLDEAGIYRYDGGQSVEPISDPIQNMFHLDAASPAPQVDWSADQSLWHATVDPVRETIRWFVHLVGDDSIAHALCYHHRRKSWWIEQYPFPVTSSATGTLDYRRALVGTEGRRVLCLAQGTLDVAANLGTLAGTATSASATTLTDASASFAATLAGAPVTITGGTGQGQQATISSNTADTLTLVNPWSVTPDATSTYQVGGVAWVYQSGWWELDAADETEQARDFLLTYRPLQAPTRANMQLYFDHSATPRTWTRTLSQDGVATVAGSPQVAFDLANRRSRPGFSYHRFSSHRDDYAYGDGYLSASLSGVQGTELVQVYQVGVRGVISPGSRNA